MSALYLATLLLAASPAEEEEHYPLAAPPPVRMPAQPPSKAELRKAHSDAMRMAYRVEVWEAVPELVKVYRLLEQDKTLTSSERAELRFKTRARLLALGDKIVSDARRERNRERQAEAAAKRGVWIPLEAPPPSSGRPSDYARGSTTGSAAASGTGFGSGGAAAFAAAGGLGQDGGEALVELIRSTIAPESWDTAGGPGTIVYYRQWQALVIRQTEEVHWLIGGLRGALGK